MIGCFKFLNLDWLLDFKPLSTKNMRSTFDVCSNMTQINVSINLIFENIITTFQFLTRFWLSKFNQLFETYINSQIYHDYTIHIPNKIG